MTLEPETVKRFWRYDSIILTFMQLQKFEKLHPVYLFWHYRFIKACNFHWIPEHLKRILNFFKDVWFISQKGVFMWGKNYIELPSISSIKNILKCKDKLTDKSIIIVCCSEKKFKHSPLHNFNCSILIALSIYGTWM